MHKSLLKGTAALGLLIASGAVAQESPPQSTAAKLTISGSTTFHVSAFNQKATTSAGDAQVDAVGKGQGYNFSQDDSILDFTFAGKTDSNIDYLGRINFTGQTGSSTVANNYSVRSRLRQNYVQFGYMGATVQGGALWGVEVVSVSDGSAIMRGDGGFGSNWSSRFNEPFVALPTGTVPALHSNGTVNTGQTVALPGNTNGSTGNMIYGAYLAGSSNTANKLSLITPTVYGFHVSASMTPSTAHTGDLYHNNAINPQGRQALASGGTTQSTTTNFASQYFDQNHQAYALSFSESFGEVSISASGATVMSSQTKDSDGGAPSWNKTRGYYVGATVSAFGFDLGGGFYDNKKTGVTLAQSATGRDGGKTWNVALGWSAGPWAVTVGYLHGSRNNGTNQDLQGATNVSGTSVNFARTGLIKDPSKSKASLYSITADLKLADGLTTYIDATHAKMTDGSIDPKYGKRTNTGTVVLLGTRVNF